MEKPLNDLRDYMEKFDDMDNINTMDLKQH